MKHLFQELATYVIRTFQLQRVSTAHVRPSPARTQTSDIKPFILIFEISENRVLNMKFFIPISKGKFRWKDTNTEYYKVITKKNPKLFLKSPLTPSPPILGVHWKFSGWLLSIHAYLNLLDQIKGSQPTLILPPLARSWPPLKHRWVTQIIG